MQIRRIHHVGLVVRDLDRAAAFYREVLGLPEIAVPPTFAPAGLEVRWFDVGEGQQLHLIRGEEPAHATRRHVALQVDDAQAARDAIRARGVEIRETIPIPGTDRFFVDDPEGNRIELIEWRADGYLTSMSLRGTTEGSDEAISP